MTASILERDERDPLYGHTRAEFESELRAALRGRAEAAYFFGSYASGTLSASSDIDLIIVAQTTRPFVERARDYFDLLDIVPRMDILVYTPEELVSLTTNPSVGFWTQVTSTMRPLFEGHAQPPRR